MTVDPTLSEFDSLANEIVKLTTDLANSRAARDDAIAQLVEARTVIHADQDVATARRVWEAVPDSTGAQQKLDAAVTRHRVLLAAWAKRYGR